MILKPPRQCAIQSFGPSFSHVRICLRVTTLADLRIVGLFEPRSNLARFLQQHSRRGFSDECERLVFETVITGGD